MVKSIHRMPHEFLRCLDRRWALHLHCSPADLRSRQTVVLADADRSGAAVWLIERTCVIAAAPPLAAALRRSVGSRNPMQAFDLGRLKNAAADFGLPVREPESVLAAPVAAASGEGILWISPAETEEELRAALDQASHVCAALMSLTLRQHAARRAADACGFVLYASVIYIGERVHP